MEIFTLEAKTRPPARQELRNLRSQGFIPGVMYGHSLKSQSLLLRYLPFERVYKEVGESTLLNLKIDQQEPVKVLIHEIQHDPVTGKMIHVDFYKVKMAEKIKTEIELKFIGEAPAVKELGGILIKNLDKIEVECFPQDLVHEIEVDLSVLATFDKMIHVSDLKVPTRVRILTRAQEVVSRVKPLSEEIEEETPAEEGSKEVTEGEGKTVAQDSEKKETKKEKVEK